MTQITGFMLTMRNMDIMEVKAKTEAEEETVKDVVQVNDVEQEQDVDTDVVAPAVDVVADVDTTASGATIMALKTTWSATSGLLEGVRKGETIINLRCGR